MSEHPDGIVAVVPEVCERVRRAERARIIVSDKEHAASCAFCENAFEFRRFVCARRELRVA
jgi:redox-regulated HSP33 family molecular chaperone